MRIIKGFVTLIRWPNLLFIILTQALFQYCIYEKLYGVQQNDWDRVSFWMLVASSVLIAAAGYIINDYFDINIDEVNKPQSLIVDTVINRRWALAWHFTLNIAGIVLTIAAVPFSQKWYLILANIGSTILLWFYSASFKKKYLIGNVVVALLTSWTIFLIFFSKFNLQEAISVTTGPHQKFFRITILYASFAAIITLIREAIKDMEDRVGDERFGCRTLPIVSGMDAARQYVVILILLLTGLLVVLMIYVLFFKWWLPVLYTTLCVILPLIVLLRLVLKAGTAGEYHALSFRTKLIMLTGILSMLFFYFYL